MLKKFHYFMELDPSPWPMMISFLANSMFLSVVLMFKFNLMEYKMNLLINLILMMMMSLIWWKDFYNENNFQGKESFSLEPMIKSGMILFITSEFMLFLSLFWTYIKFFLGPMMNHGLIWPPKNLQMFEFNLVPLVNTMILLSSSITLTMAMNKFNKNLMESSMKLMKYTIILGLMFSFLQYFEYKNSFFTISDSTFGGSFFILTGLHGAHVLIGTMYIIFCYKKMKTNLICVKNNMNMELSSWYWHFVDLIWIYVYYSLYYILTK